ncbi:MAG: 2-amino-4-hydroxy-6-hydroxymethyldihydropteridine diphosphokinase [Proteobacteria bacterium]|nr:2-amino-4-hydroxy-6-hydroxymethyldihydropteridine diphosphokinase [Pseudomonadota bacterium]
MSKIKLQIYNQSQHSINTDDISPSARAIIAKLIDHGYQAYIVGGAVRDLLLGRHPKDFDIATNAIPEEIKSVFGRKCRIIGRRFRLAHVYNNREMFEVATFRGDSATGNRVVKQGYIIKDNVFGSIDQDAIRRDFTCNALYIDIENGNILDYCSGFADIAQHRLRFIGDDNKRIVEDPIRMIRAIRFQAKLGLFMSLATKKVILKQYQSLKNVSPARLFDELVKLFHCGNALLAYELMHELLLFEYIFPQASKAIKTSQANMDFMLNALNSTDARIKNQQSVTPIFLFACFFWPQLVNETNKKLANGLPQYDAMHKATNNVFQTAMKSLSIPRMIQIGIRNIWLLQLRLENIRGKKAFLALDHPRFRAAYDFLLLRGHESSEVKALGKWWTNFQTLSKTQQEQLVFPKKKPLPQSKNTSEITCYLGLGSNIGDASSHIKNAIKLLALDANIEVQKTAPMYLTKAWGNTKQQDFVNTVVEIVTKLPPAALLTCLQNIEKSLGRKKINKWAPRIIDIDILVYADFVVKQPQLTIPHPHIIARAFVLVPLLEINPEIQIPYFGKLSAYIDEEMLESEIIGIV